MIYQVPNCSTDLLTNKNLIIRQNKKNPTTRSVFKGFSSHRLSSQLRSFQRINQNVLIPLWKLDVTVASP